MGVYSGPKYTTKELICSIDTSNVLSYAGRPTTNFLVTTAWGQANSQGRADQRPFNATSHSSQEHSTLVRPKATPKAPPSINTNVWRVIDSNPDGYSRFSSWTGMSVDDLGGYDVDYVASSYVLLPRNVTLHPSNTAIVYQSSTSADWHGNWDATASAAFNATYNYWSYNPMTATNTVREADQSIRGKWQRIYRSFRPSLSIRNQESGVTIDKLTGYFRPALVGQLGRNFFYVTASTIEPGRYPSKRFVQGSRPLQNAIRDLSGEGNHITLRTTTVYDEENDDAPIYGGYSSGFITHSQSFNDMEEMTIYTWIKPVAYSTTSNSSNILLIKGWSGEGSWFLGFDNTIGSNAFRFAVNFSGTARIVSAPISLNEWHHITCTYKKLTETMRIYHNGVLIHERDVPSAANLINSGDILVGRNTGNDPTFDGKMEVLKIYREQHSPSRILKQYNTSKKRFGH